MKYLELLIINLFFSLCPCSRFENRSRTNQTKTKSNDHVPIRIRIAQLWSLYKAWQLSDKLKLVNWAEVVIKDWTIPSYLKVHLGLSAGLCTLCRALSWPCILLKPLQVMRLFNPDTEAETNTSSFLKSDTKTWTENPIPQLWKLLNMIQRPRVL